eukprot:scaffold888_cov569-Prasinococcus_capsulatus_cf.AAC.13
MPRCPRWKAPQSCVPAATRASQSHESSGCARENAPDKPQSPPPASVASAAGWQCEWRRPRRHGALPLESAAAAARRAPPPGDAALGRPA